MARSMSRRDDDLEEINDDSLRMREDDADTRASFSLEDDDVEALELGDRGRKGFSRLTEDMFRDRGF